MNKIKVGLVTIIISGAVLAGCGADTNQSEAPVEEVQAETQTNQPKESAPSVETTKFFFTADEGGSISKVNASTNELVEIIEVEGIAHNVQVSPDGKLLGVTVVPHGEDSHGEDSHGDHSEKGKALFFDIETNELIKTVEVGNHPAHFVFTEDGKYALVTNTEDNNVSIIDVDTFSVIDTVETGKGPHGFRISADSQKVYIANMGEDSISVLNLETMKEESRITVGANPVTTGVTSDGKTMVATLNTENSLAIVDLESGIVEKVEVGNGPAQVYIDQNDQYAYIANQGTEENPSNTVTVVDLTAKKATTTIETGKGAHGVVTSSDSKRLYVTNMFENTVTVIETEQNEVIDTIKVGKIPNGISIMN
ncbi:YncE family protein [Mesobacillus maritimus]|uniref:YncE family protein n=1 Tax=Mesobacillus maritimus TaxID=1643336 RepID=UPI00384BF1AC